MATSAEEVRNSEGAVAATSSAPVDAPSGSSTPLAVVVATEELKGSAARADSSKRFQADQPKSDRKLRRILSDSDGRARFELGPHGIRHAQPFKYSVIDGCEWWQAPLHTATTGRRVALQKQSRPLVVHSLCTGLGGEFLALEAHFF